MTSYGVLERFKTGAINRARPAATFEKRVDGLVRYPHPDAHLRSDVEKIRKEVAGESSIVIHAIEEGNERFRCEVGSDDRVQAYLVGQQLIVFLVIGTQLRSIIRWDVEQTLEFVRKRLSDRLEF